LVDFKFFIIFSLLNSYKVNCRYIGIIPFLYKNHILEKESNMK